MKKKSVLPCCVVGNGMEHVSSPDTTLSPPVQDVLGGLLRMSESELADWAAESEDLTLGFLCWVEQRCSEAVTVEDRDQLTRLGSKLTSLREMHSQDASSSVALSDFGPGTVSGSQGLVALQRRAQEFESHVARSKAQTLTEILGKKLVTDPAEYQRLDAASDAASRILEVLMQVEDRAERASMLPAAFTPPELLGPTVIDMETEDVYTTPIRLLQVVDLWLRRTGDGPNTPSPPEGCEQRRRGLLEELREDIVAYGGTLESLPT